MRGFVRIFEAIVASIILLTSLSFFFISEAQKSDWDDAALQTLAQDALESSYLNGALTRYVKTDDTAELNSLFSSMLPRTVDFSIEVRGIPNKIIYVACVECSPADVDELSTILRPTEFSYKRQNISIRIQPLSAIEPVPEDTSIMFFFDKTKIASYQSKIDTFLGNGRSVFLLGDLTQDDANGLIGSVFNLTWSGTSSSPAKFDSVSDAGKISHFVARYYANISSRDLYNIELQVFVFHSNGIKAQNDGRDIAKTDDGVAFVRANYNAVNNKGRTVWSADYERLNHALAATKAADNLTKASVMWASGERFTLDLIKKAPAPVHFRSSIFVFDEDNYIVDLIIWRIFF